MAEETTLLVWGHVALGVCFALYLLWWWVFFWPRVERPKGTLRTIGIVSIIGAAVCGLGGIGLVIAGIAGLPVLTETIPAWSIAIGGMIAYVALFIVTAVLLNRPPTSELFIITGWAVLELCVANGLYGAQILNLGQTIALVIAIAILVILSLICYQRFVSLKDKAAFICGAIPLVCGIILAIVMVIIIGVI
ncbi:MAG: hypothetical protein IKE43_02520 [Coriobacteriales bacterium]|nr:hypothetical protein [Coriobacteriales bacterium]